MADLPAVQTPFLADERERTYHTGEQHEAGYHADHDSHQRPTTHDTHAEIYELLDAAPAKRKTKQRTSSTTTSKATAKAAGSHLDSDGTTGRLQSVAASVLMKALYAARMARLISFVQ